MAQHTNIQQDNDGLFIAIDDIIARPDHDYNYSAFNHRDLIDVERLGKSAIVSVKKNDEIEYWRIKN